MAAARQSYVPVTNHMEDRKGYLHHHQFGGCCCYRRSAEVDSSECQISRTSNRVLLERAVLSVCLCFEGKGKMMLGCARAALKRVLKRIRAELRGIRKKKAARPIQRFQYDALSYAQNFDDGSWKDHDYYYFMSTFFQLQNPRGQARHTSVSS